MGNNHSTKSVTNSATCKTLHGDVCWTESFRPIHSENTIIDVRYDIWKQITAMGYVRISDNYFWPGDPRNTNNLANQLPPTVLEIYNERKIKFPNYDPAKLKL